MFTTTYSSPIGLLTLASDGDSLAGLWVEGQKHFGRTMGKSVAANDKLPLFGQTKRWLDRYFAGGRVDHRELPLAPEGGDFRQEVWDILLAIPYGTVTTYAHIARQMAAARGLPSMSSQAVGGAVGHNPITIIIPCHRVIGSDGSLTGFASGLAVKSFLLRLEGVELGL